MGNWFDFGSSVASSAINFAASAYGLKKQFQYNTALQKQAHDLNHDLQVRGYKQQGNLDRLGYRLSKKLQNAQNQYTTAMSNSAHQREVADLRAAGLNPILSANNGASTPAAGGAIIGGGSSSVPGVGSSSVGLSDMGSPGSSALDNYVNLKSLKNATKQTDSNIDLNKSNVGLNEATTDMNKNNSKYLLAKEANEKEQKENIIAERDQIKQNTSWLKQQELNSIAVTAATVEKFKKEGNAALRQAAAAEQNSAGNYYYNTHRALGFSKTDSFDAGAGIGLGNGKFKFGNGNVKYGKTHSETW